MARSKKANSIRVINNETEEIREVDIYDLTRNAYIEFGRHVNNWRQLPQIIDGLKISYRRLLYSALQFPQGKMIKSVMLLGKMAECFTGDTEILTCNNERIRFDELTERLNNGEDIYTFSCDSKGALYPSKIVSSKLVKTSSKILEVTLDNGESFKCTEDHKIFLRSGEYKEAKDLTVGDSLMPIHVSEFLDNKGLPRRSARAGERKWIPIYKIMSNHSDVKIDDSVNTCKCIQRHHIDMNSLNDYPTNLLLIGDQAHRVLHCHCSKIEDSRKEKAANGIRKFWSDKEGSESTRRILSAKAKLQWENEDLKKWRGELNTKRALENPKKYSEASRKSAYTKFRMSVLNILKYIDDNHLPKTSCSYNLANTELSSNQASIKFNTALNRYPELLNDIFDVEVISNARLKFQKVLLHLGVKHEELNYDSFSDEFGRLFELPLPSKNVYSRYINEYSEDVKLFTDNFILFVTRFVIRSVAYRCEDITEQSVNSEFRSLGYDISYSYIKSTFPEELSIGSYNYNHKVSSIKEITYETPIEVYCLDVDNENHNFPLASGIFVHNCHEHSTEGSYGVVAAFVKSGVFTGQGSWGTRSINGTSDPAAAPRYTEARVSDKFYKILGRLIKKVPYVESPIGPLEPTYIPVPMPLSLSLDTLVSGIGLGISTDLPNFSAKSMYQAYINDDPMLLEPGIDINMDKSKSDLKGIWNEGRGRVVYKYRWSRIKGPDGNPGMLIEGDAGIFVPRLKRIKDWQAEGKVYIEDMVTQDGAKLAIYKIPNIKSITIDDIEAEVEKICVNNNTYNLNVSDGGSAFRIPLREWIKATYTNYINLVTQDNKEEIEKVEFDIKVYSNIEQVANYIINENPKAENEEIIKATGLEPEVVSAIMSRTISNLRKTKDQTEKVKSLKDKLKELKSFNAVEFTDKIINEL